MADADAERTVLERDNDRFSLFADNETTTLLDKKSGC
jgi:hypothetical protein